MLHVQIMHAQNLEERIISKIFDMTKFNENQKVREEENPSAF